VKASWGWVIAASLRLVTSASADGLPIVHLVSNTPGDKALVPDAQFPSGSSFVVQFSASDPTLTATIEVWPTAMHPDCTTSPAESTRQYHKFAMSASGDGAARVLSATIPPLQLDQRFCYRLTPSKGFTPVDIASWTGAISGGFYADLAANAVDKTAFHDAIAKQSSATPAVVGDFTGFEEQIRDELSRSPAPRDYLTKQSAADAFKAQVAAANAKLQQADQKARSDAKTANILTCDSPTIVINHKLDAVTHLAASDDNLDATVAALKARNSSSDAFWAAKLPTLKGKTGDARDKLLEGILKAASAQKHSPVAIQLTLDEKTYVTLQDVLANLPVGTSLDTIAAQAHAIADVCHTNAATKIDAVVAADKDIADLAKAGIDLDNANATAKTALDAALLLAVTDAAPKLRISTSLAYRSNGDWATAPVGTFVSPDLGVAFAAPLAGGARTPWLMPFFGVNFYFGLVDRDVPIKELVGNTCRQLWSFSLGVSLTAPGIDGRTVDAIMFGAYPMAAIGRRLSEHVRVSAGTFFYLLHREDPTNASRIFGVAPFVGLSIDTDVYHYIQKAYTDR